MDSKRLDLKSILLSFAIIFTYLVLLLETVKYPGFIGNHFFIDAKVYFALVITLLLFVNTKSKILRFIFKVNNIVLILLSAVYLIFVLLEGANFQNYVLATFHFHLDGLILPVLFSLLLFFVDKYKNLITKSVKGLGIIYPTIVLLLIYFMVKNLAYVSDLAFNRDAYIVFHLTDTYDQKMYYRWADFYRFMVFVRNNTPTDATIVVPPQQDPWLIGTGNLRFVRAFIYPRNLIQGTLILPDLKSFEPNTYLLISWGKEECKPDGCHGWPRQDIKATKIIYKDPNSDKVIEVKENATYSLKDTKYVYGLIKL